MFFAKFAAYHLDFQKNKNVDLTVRKEQGISESSFSCITRNFANALVPSPKESVQYKNKIIDI